MRELLDNLNGYKLAAFCVAAPFLVAAVWAIVDHLRFSREERRRLESYIRESRWNRQGGPWA